MITLKSISMYSGYSGNDPPSGTITFVGDLGEVQLKLTHETTAKIVEICADQIVTAVKQAATQMSVEALGVPALLEHKQDEEDPTDSRN